MWAQEKFEEIFTQHDRDNKGGLSLRDILRLWNSHRDVSSPFITKNCSGNCKLSIPSEST